MKSKVHETQQVVKMMTSKTLGNSKAVRLVTMAAAFCLAASNVQAADYTWSATAVSSGSAFWAVSSNWSPASGASGPGVSDTAHFSAVNGDIVVRMRGANVGGIVINNTGTTALAGGNATDGDGTFTLGAGGITVNAGAGAVSVGFNVGNYRVQQLNLSASQSWINNSSNLLSRVGNASRVGINLGANALTIGGSGDTALYHDLQGTGGSLGKTGLGTLTISSLGSASTYSGATTVSAGTLILTSAANINSTSGLSVASGGTFTNNSTIAFSKGISLAEGAVINGSGAFAPASLSITADLTDGLTAFNLGSASLTKSGDFSLTLSGVTDGAYTLFLGGSISGSFDSMFIGGTELASIGAGNFSGMIANTQYFFDNSTNQVIINTIPEPSMSLLLGGGVGGLILLWRRRSVAGIDTAARG